MTCNDPMDSPPIDHGSDRYDYVEITGAPPGVQPHGAWWDALLAEACPDCRAKVAKEFNDADHDGRPVDLSALRKELIQVAAMAAAWADAVPVERETQSS